MTTAATADVGEKLGPFLAMMVVAGGMIGSGIYLLPASLGAFGSVSILGWVLAVAGAAALGGVFSFLAILRPRASGLFSYIREALGPGVGFVSGVVYWVLCWIGNVPLAVGVTGYLSVFFPLVAKPPAATICSVAVIWLLIGANIVGPKFIARVGGWTLTLGLAPVLLVASGGWFYFHPSIFMDSWNVTHKTLWQVVPTSAVIAFYSFLGVENASIIAPLVRHPARDVPIATLGGLAFAAVVYVSSCGVMMGILPAAALARSDAPFAAAAAPILGAIVAGGVALCAMLKATGSLGVNILTTAETARSDAVIDELTTRRARPPARKASAGNLVLIGVLMSLVTVTSANPSLGRQFAILANVTVVLSMAVYAAACVALFRISGELEGRRRLSVRACAFIAGLFSCAMIAVSEADLLFWSVGAVAIATASYAVVRRTRGRRRAESAAGTL
jgi:arginine:agmatine antiporter